MGKLPGGMKDMKPSSAAEIYGEEMFFLYPNGYMTSVQNKNQEIKHYAKKKRQTV